jgi:septal ring factor EnvC (AmiA/AmiB activator)
MSSRIFAVLAALVTLAVAVLVFAGCQPQPATPNEKQARLLAAQNRDLEQRLTARQAEIQALQQKQADELRRRDEELAKCKARIDALQKDLEKNVAERVRSVTATVMNENAKLRQEVADLKAQLKKLKAAAPPAGQS